MSAMELLNYPGTWTWLAVVAVLVGGLVGFAVALRRLLRTPPPEEPRPAAAPAPASSAPSAKSQQP